jgi:PST family polysaccharide transporter
MTATVRWLFLSQGRRSDLLKVGLFNAITAVASFLRGLPWGPLGVATAYTISDYLLRLPATLWSAGRRGPVGMREVVATAITLPHAAATFVTGGVLIGIALTLPNPNSTICIMLLAVLSYSVYSLVMWPSQQSESS